MLSTTTAIIHWDEPEEPNGQVVGYRVYYTSDNTLPVNQVCTGVGRVSHVFASMCPLALMHRVVYFCREVGEADGAQRQLHHHPGFDS